MLIRLFLIPLLAGVTAPDGPAIFTRTAPGRSTQRCDRIGEVLERHVFEQTFSVKLDEDGQTDTIPYSRWTQFLRGSSEPGAEPAKEIEPTGVRTGERLCVVLDPSGATSSIVFVIETPRHIRSKSK